MTEETGRILWTHESKHYLLRLIRENPVIISPNVSSETMLKKEMAWMNIEKCFASDGMVCQLGKIKRLWKRMKVLSPLAPISMYYISNVNAFYCHVARITHARTQ